MHIAVCCKGVPKAPGNISLSDDQTAIRYEGASLIMNESDEYALDEAILIKKKTEAKVTAITLGSLATQEILYLALAKGADEAIRVDSRAWSPSEVATLLGKVIERKSVDMVLVGVQSADHMGSIVGGLLAEALGCPFAFAVTSIELPQEGSWVGVEKELGEGKLQRLEMDLPVVLGVQTGICPLTYAPPVRRLKARQKSIEVWDPGKLGVTPEILETYRRERIEEIIPPVVSQSAQILQGTSQEMATFLLDRIKEAV